jgi:glycosyltransferase involved in cell wall biosynthesis
VRGHRVGAVIVTSEREALVLNTPTVNIPLVSIIVPLYNHARYVEATLESFRTEGYPALEVVIIDDGSTDNSFEVARNWLKAHPNAFKNVVLERQENRGITKTLNRLVSLSHGAFITMVASDDLLLPGGIQARLEALQARPDWLAVFGDARMIDQNGATLAESALRKINRANKKALLNDALRTQELLLRWSVPGPVLLTRRSAYNFDQGVGLYNEDIFLEDRDFYLRLLSRNALGFIDTAVAAYRWHPRNSFRLKVNLLRSYEAIYQSELRQIPLFTGEDQKTLIFLARYAEYSLKSRKGSSVEKTKAIISSIPLEIERFWRLVRHNWLVK